MVSFAPKVGKLHTDPRSAYLSPYANPCTRCFDGKFEGTRMIRRVLRLYGLRLRAQVQGFMKLSGIGPSV